MSASVLGAIAIAIHVLAAAMWCGTLAALVLTVDIVDSGRGCCRDSPSCRCGA